jgi:hypothetical protein
LSVVFVFKVLLAFLQGSGLGVDNAFGARAQWEKQHVQRMTSLAKPRTAYAAGLDATRFVDDHNGYVIYGNAW